MHSYRDKRRHPAKAGAQRHFNWLKTLDSGFAGMTENAFK